MWSKRRRPSAPPVLLPSLDRLAALIERVVELVDAVGGTQPEPEPAEPREAPRAVPEPTAPVAAETADDAWLAFVPSPHGYGLVERSGPAPGRGEVLELDGARYRVVRLAPSPLPGDRRRTVYVEREEPSAEDRTFDA